jgi:hypothetical protein
MDGLSALLSLKFLTMSASSAAWLDSSEAADDDCSELAALCCVTELIEFTALLS